MHTEGPLDGSLYATVNRDTSTLSSASSIRDAHRNLSQHTSNSHLHKNWQVQQNHLQKQQAQQNRLQQQPVLQSHLQKQQVQQNHLKKQQRHLEESAMRFDHSAPQHSSALAEPSHPSRKDDHGAELDQILSDLLSETNVLSDSGPRSIVDVIGRETSRTPNSGTLTTHFGNTRTTLSWETSQAGPTRSATASTYTTAHPDPQSHVGSRSSQRKEVTSYTQKLDDGGSEQTVQETKRTHRFSEKCEDDLRAPIPNRLNTLPYRIDYENRASAGRELPDYETRSDVGDVHNSHWLYTQQQKLRSKQQRTLCSGRDRQFVNELRNTQDRYAEGRLEADMEAQRVMNQHCTATASPPKKLEKSGDTKFRFRSNSSLGVPETVSRTESCHDHSSSNFKSERNYFVSGVECPAFENRQTKYSFSVSSPRPGTAHGSAPTSPTIPPRTSSRDVMKSKWTPRGPPTPQQQKSGYSSSQYNCQTSNYESKRSTNFLPPEKLVSPTVAHAKHVVSNETQSLLDWNSEINAALEHVDSGLLDGDEEIEEEIISLQPVGQGVHGLEERSATPSFPTTPTSGFACEEVFPDPLYATISDTKRTAKGRSAEGRAQTLPLRDVNASAALLSKTTSQMQQFSSLQRDGVNLLPHGLVANGSSTLPTAHGTHNHHHQQQMLQQQFSQQPQQQFSQQQHQQFSQHQQQHQQQQQQQQYQQRVDEKSSTESHRALVHEEPVKRLQATRPMTSTTTSVKQSGTAVRNASSGGMSKSQSAYNTTGWQQNSSSFGGDPDCEDALRPQRSRSKHAGSLYNERLLARETTLERDTKPGNISHSTQTIPHSRSTADTTTGRVQQKRQHTEIVREYQQSPDVDHGVTEILRGYDDGTISSSTTHQRKAAFSGTSTCSSDGFTRTTLPSRNVSHTDIFRDFGNASVDSAPSSHSISRAWHSRSETAPLSIETDSRLHPLGPTSLESATYSPGSSASGMLRSDAVTPAFPASPSLFNNRVYSVNSLAGEDGSHTPKFVRDTSRIWYKPKITREEAIRLLCNAPSGSFVVRDSNSFAGAFGLALRVSHLPPNVEPKPGQPNTELVRHFLIEPTANGVKLKGCSNEPVFGSLSSLVYQHSITPLALPCKLVMPEISNAELQQSSELSANQLFSLGAACNVLFVASVPTESLTGPEAVAKAVKTSISSEARTTLVHFKVSNHGITLTDSRRRLFFRRHYPINTITYCGIDPEERLWSQPMKDGQVPRDSRLFGFVARKSSAGVDNECHLFAQMDPQQPAQAVVNFVTKVMMNAGHQMKC